MMVNENNFQVHGHISCIVYYIYILQKLCCKGYEKYLMGKLFSSDPGIENGKVYVVTNLIHDYTPSQYEETVSQYSANDLADPIWLKNC